MKELQVARVGSPLGELVLWAQGETLVGLEFADLDDRVGQVRRRLERTIGPFREVAIADPAGAATRLRRYFAGELEALEGQAVRVTGSAFEEQVWAALRTIGCGQVRSYGQLAAALGARGASRAVGAANGRNPVALFVPCHRVIAADGSLHGYGGGLERKRWLLTHEKAQLLHPLTELRQIALRLRARE